jgi:probable DNA metabolism protein
MTIIYEDSFEGFMSALYWSFQINTERLISERYYQPQLFEQTTYVGAQREIASRLAKRIMIGFGECTFEKIYHAYLSESENTAIVVKTFLNYGKDQPSDDLIRDYNHVAVYPLLQLARLVEREAHRMYGLIRFAPLRKGVYYARFESTHNILPLLALHFESRLSDQGWILHDAKRGVGAFYDGQTRWFDSLSPQKGMLVINDTYEDLWKIYYKSIAIDGRKNRKRRQSFMPKKYWSNLPEMQE